MTDVLVPETTSEPLVSLDLPKAPPVIRATATRMRRPKAPAIALLVLGGALTFGPILGGLFSKVASGKQMIDQFAPHMEADTRARYGTDLQTLRRAAKAVDTIYIEQGVPRGRFPGLDVYRDRANAIDAHATSLLDRVNTSEPDYRRIANIGGFARIPFLLVLYGVALMYAAYVLLCSSGSRARAAVGLIVVASVALAAYPFVSDLRGGTKAGQRMLHTFAPMMTHGEVRELQDDFVVLVTADGELDTGFRTVPQTGQAAADVTALITGWPGISSDLASLVGTVNDNIGNFNALDDINSSMRRAGASGLESFAWLLVGLAVAGAALSAAAVPRRRREK